MLDFEFVNTTKLVFGRNVTARVAEFAGNYGKTALLVYGGGHIEKTGLLAGLKTALRENGIECVTLGGVRPNPTYEISEEGIRMGREHSVELIIAVGGGSVMDAAKCMAMGIPYPGEAWDFYCKKASPAEALPIIAIPTIPAAGSETSPNSVITRAGKKLGAKSDLIRPKVCLMDPSLFMTLPKDQIANGLCDMLSHIFERYFTTTEHTEFTDGLCESVMRTILRFGPIVYRDPGNYDAWCQIALSASYAHNGTLGIGRKEDWVSHRMEHELSAVDPTIAHGAGLAVVIPGWMQYVWRSAPAIFCQFAMNVMGVPYERNEERMVEEAIHRLKEFYAMIGLPSCLRQLNVQESELPLMAERCAANNPGLGGVMPIGSADAEAIYRSVF